MGLKVGVAGALHSVAQPVHPVLRLSDLQRHPEAALQMDYHRRSIPAHPVQPELLRRALEVGFELAADLGGHGRRAPRLGLRHQALDAVFINRVDPAAQAHARQSQHLGSPARTLPLDDQQQRGDLHPDPRPGHPLGEGEQLLALGGRIFQIQTRRPHGNAPERTTRPECSRDQQRL